MNRVSGRQWASKKKTKIIGLPSGAVVEVKEGGLYTVMIANMLPLPLLKKVMEPASESTPSENAEVVVAMRKIVGLVMTVVVSPRIVDGPTQSEEEISLVDVPDEDIYALIKYVVRGEAAEALAPFRNGAGSADDRQPLPQVQPETVHGDGD